MYKSIITALASANASLVKELASLRRKLSALKSHENSEQSRKHHCWLFGANCNHPRYLYPNPKEDYKERATTANQIGRETRRSRASF